MARCTMSEKHAEDGTAENSLSVNRRSIIKAFGATSSVIAFSTLGSTSAVGTPNRRSIDIRTIDESPSSQRVQKARDNPEFKQIKRYLLENENVEIVEDDIEIYIHEDEDNTDPSYIVSFPLDSTINEDVERSGIAVALYRDEVQSVSAVKMVKINDNIRKLYDYNIEDGKVQKETSEINIEDMTFDYDSTISPNASFGCDACFAAGDAICTIGCTGSIAVICLALNISGYLGVGCTIFAGAFCAAITFLNEHTPVTDACSWDTAIECACTRLDAGDCIDNPSFPANCS